MNTVTLKNRILSVVLTVIMVFSMLPLSVFAAGGNVAEVTIDGTTTGYTDIDAAFAAAQEADSATVKLLADVTVDHSANETNKTYGIQLEKGDITLELNGMTISQQSGIAQNKFYPASAVFHLSVPGGSTTEEVMASLKANVRLTVQDSVGGGKIVQPNGGPAIVATDNGTLTVNSGVIENTSSDDFDDGCFHNTPNCAVLLSDGGKAVINGGTLSGMRGVAVAGYITKEVEQLYKDYLGIEGYNNDTYGNELTVAGGEISGTSGNALIVYDKAKKIELSGGTFSTQSNEHSIWAADSTPEGEDPIKGDAASLLAAGYRYENNGAECAYSAEGNGVVGNAKVALRPANETAYIGADGKLTAQANCAEITAETDDISHGWYVLKEDVTVSLLNISEEVHLILCDGATLTVSSYFNVGQDSTLNLYWQSAGTGKLTAKAISMMGTVTAPAGGMKQTTGASGTTFEKCFEHDWEYKNNGDTHTATCKLCGAKETAAHNYDTLQSTDAENHTFACACGATSTENHTLTLAPNDDGLTHSSKCSVCGYATAAETHDFSSTDEFGNKKCACGVHLAAKYNEKNYATLESAIKAAKDGGKVTLQAVAVAENITIEDGTKVTIDLNGKEWYNDNMNGAIPVLTVKGGNVTVQNGTLIAGSSSKADTAVVVEGGRLTVGADMTIQGGSMDKDKQFPAIEVTKSGELTLSGGAELGFGMKVSAEGKLIKDYLPEGTAFTVNGSVINGYVQELSGNFTLVVAEHTHRYENGTCACGAACEHTGGTAGYFKKAVCATCGAEYGELLTDTTAPTGSITIKNRTPFESFINAITFNIFFKETVTATITAKDDSYTHEGYTAEKAVKVEYLVADKGLDETALKDQTFTAYNKNIDLSNEQNYVVYAKLTDWAGNETLLSTDGLVIDKTAPSIGDFTDGQEVHICGQTSYTVTVADTNLDTVTVDGVKQTGNSVTFRMAEFNNTHTVVAEDKAGNTSTVTFTLHGGHNYNIETGVCENGCGAAAEVKLTDGTGTRVWGKYDDALIEIMRGNTPATVTLLKDCGDQGGHPTQYSKDGLDLTIDLNGHDFGNASDQLCVLSQTADGSAKLNLIGEGSFKTEVWLSRGATLTVGEKVTYVGGIKIWYDASYGDKVTDLSVSLKGGKYSEIDLTYTNKNGDAQSVGTLGDLLVPGYVFKTDVASLSTANDVEVEACPGHVWNNGACARCKLVCTHNWVDSTCTLCGYECLHSSVEERGGSTYCTEMCGAQMAVKVEYIDVNGTLWTKYYARAQYTYNGVDYENTLQVLFNDDTITPSGSTVTLLAGGLQAWAHVKGGKTVTLDLNGKKLIETANGICTFSDNSSNKLIVTGTGHSVENASVSFGRTFAVYGGTLELASGFGGEFHEVYASGGTLTFAEGQSAEINVLTIAGDVTVTPLKSGKFGKIVTEGSATRTASSLLERRYAFQKADGSYVPYHTEITATGALENVTVVWCDHQMPEVPEGSQYHDTLHCPNCNEGLEAVLTTADGKSNGYEELTSAYGKTTALSVAGNTPGCTVTMYCNAGGLSIWSTAEGFTLDANDCTIGQLTLHSGTLTVKNATITGDEHTDDPTVMTLYDSTVATLTLEDCLVEKQKEGPRATLTANGPVTLKNTVIDGTTYVLSDTDEGLTVEGNSRLVGDTRVDGNLTFKSGNASTSKITVYGAAEISGGLIYELDASNAGRLTVSGGTFGKITAPDEKKLIDCLKDGYAFYEDGGDNSVVDGRNSTLEWVYVAEHTHGEYKWDPATHEKVCACGHATETDYDLPTISGIVSDETYYQNTLTFTVTDTGSGLASVKDGDTVLTADASGEYTIPADNAVHIITATDNAGNTTTVTIKVYKIYRVTLVSGTGYTVEGNPTVGHGQDYTFTVKITKGYSATRDFTVYLNGSIPLVTPDPDSAGVYTFTFPNAPQDLSFTVKGVADITAPDVEMTIGANKFKELLNSLTFGLFFKKTQTVTVTATDLGSGVDDATAEYLVIDGLFDKTSMPTEGWTSFEMKNGKGSFSIEPNAIGSVYVRIKDKDGNLALINSDGVVLYTDSEVRTDSHEFTRLSTGEVAIAVVLNGNGVKAIRCGDTELVAGTDYTVAYNSTPTGLSSITLKNDWLKTLAAGEYTVTVAYNPMGEAYAEKNGNEAPATTTVKLTVLKNTRSLTFEAPNAVYDGEAYDDLRITDKPGSTAVQYKKQSAEDSTYTTDAPKNVGNYTVRISVDTDENYNAATFTKDFTISKAEVTVGGLTAYNKVYNGNTEAAVKGTATLSTNYDGENLTVIQGKANFADKNVGNDKTVTFSGFRLGGSAKDNYELKSQPQSVTADITVKEVTVSGTAVKSARVYNGSTTAEITENGTLNGIEVGDKLNIVKGKADYADKNVGKNKTVTFTEFKLGGADRDNYKLKTQPQSVTADITAKEVTVSGTAVRSSKIYDGKTTAEITENGTLNGVEDGDKLNIVKGKADYADKNVGKNKTVTFTEFKLGGADKGNYKLKTQPQSVTADITAREVTINGTAVKSTRVYNGSTSAEITENGTLNGVEDGDGLNIVKGKADYADKNVGKNKTVTFTEFNLGGADKGNYKLKAQPQSVTAEITAKELTVANLKVKDKLYDGTARAEIDGTPTLTGVEGSDTVRLVCGTPSFVKTDYSINAPIGITFTKFTLSGTDSGNYTVDQPTGITARIKSWNADKNMYTTTTQDWSNKPFTVTANDGYLLSLTDTADGKWVTSLTGSETAARTHNYLTFYVKDAATGAISTSNRYGYLYETTAPTGTITFNERTSFQKFLNTITFGLFYKDDVTVKLTANDEASGVKLAEYYKSDKALSIEELKAVTDWTVGKSFGITAEDMKRFVIYACITDNAGNVTYISSDGAEFDTAPPKIIGIENGKTYYVTQRVTITDRNLSSVTVNGEPVSTSFDLVGDKDAVYTVIATDKAGNASEYTVTAKPITDITDKIKNITEENVKSGNAEGIKAVEQQLLGIVSESEEAVIGEEQWIKLQTAAKHCKALQVSIAATAAESSRLTDTVGDYDIDKISNADKTDIEQLITDIDTLLSGENLTDTERAATEALRGTARTMLDRISAAKTAAENGEITATEDITESNVTADDKDALKKAENALENALKGFGGNYTEEEHKNMESALTTVKEALKAIENAEKAAKEIKKLPSVDKVKLSDKNEIERIKKLIDSLTENEKAMIGEEALGRVKGVFEQIEALTAKAKSPKTGDTHNLTLWFALLFISMSGAGITRAVGVRKKSYKK